MSVRIPLNAFRYEINETIIWNGFTVSCRSYYTGSSSLVSSSVKKTNLKAGCSENKFWAIFKAAQKMRVPERVETGEKEYYVIFRKGELWVLQQKCLTVKDITPFNKAIIIGLHPVRHKVGWTCFTLLWWTRWKVGPSELCSVEKHAWLGMIGLQNNSFWKGSNFWVSITR